MDCMLLHHLMWSHLHGCTQSCPPLIKIHLYLKTLTVAEMLLQHGTDELDMQR